MTEANSRRFAISTLSKSRVSDAYNGELMGDKYTGELLFKTPDGDSVSYMANIRKRNSIDSIVTNMLNHGYVDFNIYEAYADEVLPTVLVNSTLENNSLLLHVPTPEFASNRPTAFSIIVDIDFLEKNISGITSKILEPTRLLIRPYNSSGERIFNSVCAISELKHRVFTIDPDTQIDYIEVMRRDKLPDDIDFRIVLHSIIIAANNVSE